MPPPPMPCTAMRVKNERKQIEWAQVQRTSGNWFLFGADGLAPTSFETLGDKDHRSSVCSGYSEVHRLALDTDIFI